MRTIYVYERRKAKPTVKVLEERKLGNGGVQRVTNIYKSKGHPVGVAALLLPEEGEDGVGYIGVARCALSDTFVKKEGRRIALEKAERLRNIHQKNPKMPVGSFNKKLMMGTVEMENLEHAIDAMRHYSVFISSQDRCRKEMEALRALTSMLPEGKTEDLAIHLLKTVEGTPKGKELAQSLLAESARDGVPVPPKVKARLLEMAHKEG